MTGLDGDLSSPALPGNTGAGSEKKRKKAVFDPLSKRWMCSECQTSNAPSGNQRQFVSRQAACGHMQVHTRLAKQQAEGRASLSESCKKKRNEEVPRTSGMSQSLGPSEKQSKSDRASLGPMPVDNNQPQQRVPRVREEKEKELAEDAHRKEKHGKIDLNKPPVDDDNDDGKGA